MDKLNQLMPASLDLQSLALAYRNGLTPSALVDTVLARAQADDHYAWISLMPRERMLAMARELEARDPATLPLYGVPFAVKDNIDLAALPTTAGCPDFAYQPEADAFVVARLVAAGALPIGKTNLDQFATGLNGTRSPYGACRNAIDPTFISGGSSSGSAVTVASGQVSFSLGTDTAGSGRVPAAFNNIVGHKPTCGLLSASGVVPACRSLDTMSIFALTADDAQRVLAVAQGFDEADAYSRAVQPHGFDFGRAARFRVGVPRAEQLAFFGDAQAASLFDEAVQRVRELGGEAVEVDFAPFLEAARLLYEGPWVAERYQAIRAFIDAKPEALFPVTREITLGGATPLAADAFAAQYRLRMLKRRCDAVWRDVDCMLTPTAGAIYTIAQMQADPLRLNSNLGYYTNFMNLLDYAAVAVPAGFREDGMPFGVTFCAPAFQDTPLLNLAARWQRLLDLRLGASKERVPAPATVGLAQTSGQIELAVCGAHLQGLPLNHQLLSRGARLVARTRSAPHYRLYALAGGPPQRPGMLRVEQGGAAIEVEVWEMPVQELGSFVAAIPAPLGIAKLELADGRWVSGFICESAGLSGARDITAHGGWRAWLASSEAGQAVPA
ncbi:allophanate hydrolase [Uliginosibacterium sp. H1]|uniref:allophanate hydrolase n=1 Tax=Uliginosibacterium sp. H1 TaxID=3114757 RepID=UPI002E19A347|nr:allophanate hydrolase [Uliginosibacterium sp. H1]